MTEDRDTSKHTSPRTETDGQSNSPRPRRLYRSPVLTVWGTLEDLTRGTGGRNYDGSNNSSFV
jgi:hypothetical protein